jgi:hypothetical protein
MSRAATTRTAPARLSQALLDVTGCDEPDCNHDHSVIHLQPRCHPQAGMSVAYHKATGNLDIRCKKCNAPAAVIGVAPT